MNREDPMITTNDTICALATAPGVAGLAVIRVSGPQAFAIVDSLLEASTKISDADSHRIIYGKLRQAPSDDIPGHILDTVTCSVFRTPHSYTGEDVVEIGCHGGVIVPGMILDQLYAAGARCAGPGEFTKRAFLHGKLDLTQVESVADIIHSSSEASARVAGRQLFGAFKKTVAETRARLIELCGLLELELDFAQEDVEFVSRDKLRSLLQSALDFCVRTQTGFASSVVLRNGYTVAFVGRPNVGKSMLYNNLLGFPRSLVHNREGTTRDYIQEAVVWNGLRIQLCDTAGLRVSDDEVEVEGMERGSMMVSNSHMVLVVNDGSAGLHNSDQLVDELRSRNPDKYIILVQNKWDQVLASDGGTVYPVEPPQAGGVTTINISAKTGYNIESLRDIIIREASECADLTADVLLNERHMGVLKYTEQCLRLAMD
ncbi:MAG: tRNA uridine-5-carboxymethylaminomethyl(34) synthesis GTPase MnmE, partial [Candidatus Kapaibacterium sp.]